MSARSFGVLLRQLRKAKSMTQKQLCEKIGYQEPSAIEHFENGRNKPARDVVIKLADALGLKQIDRDRLLRELNYATTNTYTEVEPFSELLHTHMTKKKVATPALAAKAGISGVAINSFLRGKKPSMESVKKLADALELRGPKRVKLFRSAGYSE